MSTIPRYYVLSYFFLTVLKTNLKNRQQNTNVKKKKKNAAAVA